MPDDDDTATIADRLRGHARTTTALIGRAAELIEAEDPANTRDIIGIIDRLAACHDDCVDLLLRGAELAEATEDPA